MTLPVNNENFYIIITIIIIYVYIYLRKGELYMSIGHNQSNPHFHRMQTPQLCIFSLENKTKDQLNVTTWNKRLCTKQFMAISVSYSGPNTTFELSICSLTSSPERPKTKDAT